MEEFGKDGNRRFSLKSTISNSGFPRILNRLQPSVLRKQLCHLHPDIRPNYIFGRAALDDRVRFFE